MSKYLNLIPTLVICVIFQSCQKTEHDDFFFDDYNSLEEKIANFRTDINYDDSAAFDMAVVASVNSQNRGKTVGVFGGSLSCMDESVFAKYLWAKYLDMKIFNYGINGYGFASSQGSIQNQVDKAKEHDIYILWASTNDYTNSKEIGNYTDYSKLDDFDESKLDTQCGGLNYCIRTLRSKNPKAKIFIFGSLPFYQYKGGYSIESKDSNKKGYSFYQYIEGQRRVAEFQDIKFFNQFEIPVLSPERSSEYYQEDKFHMTPQGYANIGIYQLYFLASEMELN